MTKFKLTENPAFSKFLRGLLKACKGVIALMDEKDHTDYKEGLEAVLAMANSIAASMVVSGVKLGIKTEIGPNGEPIIVMTECTLDLLKDK